VKSRTAINCLREPLDVCCIVCHRRDQKDRIQEGWTGGNGEATEVRMQNREREE
jgi:hypothetical protein